MFVCTEGLKAIIKTTGAKKHKPFLFNGRVFGHQYFGFETPFRLCTLVYLLAMLRSESRGECQSPFGQSLD